jgi:hypothetical protein
MKLLLTARSAMSRNMQPCHDEQVDWDESGGFHVTPKSHGKGGWNLSSHLSTHSSKSAPVKRFVNNNGKGAPSSSGLRLFHRNQHQQQQQQQQQQHPLKTRRVKELLPPTNQNVCRRIRRRRIEQIPEETRVMVVYGSGTHGDAPGFNDATTVATCTTGRSTVKTEPDEYTKRAMANLILRQLLNEDDKANVNIVPTIQNPEEQTIDEKELSVEDTPPFDFFLSCCVKCYDPAAPPSSPPSSPMPAVTANRTVVSGTTSSGGGSSSYTDDDDDGSESWLTNSVQSSISWW